MPKLLFTLVRELKFSLRSLNRSRGFFAIAILTLSIGVASSSVIYSVFDAVALGPLPYESPETLIRLYERSLEDPDMERWRVAPANWRDWRSIEGLQELEAFNSASVILSQESVAQRVQGVVVSGGLFQLLGATPLRGRTIEPDDLESDRDIVVLSEPLWRTVFGSDVEIVGTTIELAGRTFEVVGVMPESFRFPYDRENDFWAPMRLSAEEMADRSGKSLETVGRLEPGVSIDVFRERAEVFARNLRDEYPVNADRGIAAATLRESWLEWRLPALQSFALAAGIALTIAALNLAGLLLTRAMSRTGGLAVRAALGAGRPGIALAVLSEALVIGVLGTLVGAGLAALMVPVVATAAPSNWAGPLLPGASVDGGVLAFTAFVGVGSAALASLLPITRIAKDDLGMELRQTGRGGGGGLDLSLRRGLVVCQTSLSVFLLAQAAMLGRSLHRIFSYDVGFDTESVLTARVPLDDGVNDSSAFYRRLKEEVAALPGVESVTLANIAPLSGRGFPVGVTTDESDPSIDLGADAYRANVEYRIVEAEFFSNLGVPVFDGRSFDLDDTQSSERVVVVNQAFVREVLGGGEGIGTTVRAAPLFGEAGDLNEPATVIGVVGDIAEWGVWMQPPIIYAPYTPAQVNRAMTIMVRTGVPPHTLAQPLEQTVWSLGNRWPVEQIRTLEEYQDRLYRMNDFMLLVLGIFSAAAATLAAMGLYGTIALQVGLRRKEISIRRALGASADRIRRGVLGEGAALTGIGIVIALAAIGLTGRWIADSWVGNFMFETSWFDPLSIAGAAALLALAAAAASIAPAYRASTVDPAMALKAES